MKLGEVGIGDTGIDTRPRDGIPALLPGLRHPSKDKTLRSRLFALLERHILPGTDRRVDRPGMEMWRIPVMGVVRQGLGCDFDRLQELVTGHHTLRQFPEHPDVWDRHRHQYQNIVDNVEFPDPELPAEASSPGVESGHAVARKKPGAPLAGRCDSLPARPMSAIPRMPSRSGAGRSRTARGPSRFSSRTRSGSSGARPDVRSGPGFRSASWRTRGLVPTHAVMWEGCDTDHAVPVLRAALARFPNLRAVSLHRGFHSPANRALLDGLPGVNALPGKGCPGKVDRERGSEREFAAMRKKHPGVESRTTNLGHRGLDLVRAHGADGLPRAVSLSVIAPTCTGSGPSCARGRGSGADAPPDGLPLPAKRGVPDRPKGPEGPPLRARRLHMEYSMCKRFRDSAGRPPRQCPGVGTGRKPEPGRAKPGGFLADTIQGRV